MKLYHPPLIKLKRLATLTTIFILAMFMTVGGAWADSDEDRHDDHSDGHSDGHGHGDGDGDGDGDGSSNNDYNLPKNSFNIMMNYE
ncbi:MAG: hypothetical protein KZQ82_17980, partial [Candidatus Thiodiazotropha sp. (ex Lucinoma annulata)]|nr:hypothetical protein [Candidatus Thiodiazotropha sp. (ex Lucinoma annulata)]